MYEVKAKAIIEGLVEKVENKTPGERLAEVKAKVTLADRLIAVEVDKARSATEKQINRGSGLA